MTDSNFPDKIKSNIQKNNLFKKTDKIIVAISGGPDSVALLLSLWELGYNIEAAHCNFHLRGEESDRDMNFTTALSAALKVKLHVTHFNTAEFAQSRQLSIEMAARQLRYNWFEEIRKENNAQYIAVAHHANDVVETFFINLTRGSGLHGLTGIKAKNGSIVRPMLTVTRQEIIQYLDQKQQSYVIDSTNNESEYVRNKFRNIIIPQFEQINPSFNASMLRTIKHLSDCETFVCNQIKSLKQTAVTATSNCTHINLEPLAATGNYAFTLFEILREWNITPHIIESISRCPIESSGQYFRSGQYKILKNRTTLELIKEDQDSSGELVEIPQHTIAISAPVALQIQEGTAQEIIIEKKNPYIATFNIEKITFPLILRHWKEGDYFYPLGAGVRKKLSDFFINEKMSRNEKSATWLLTTADNQIMWIVGKRIDNRFRVDSATTKVLRINALQQQP